MPGVIEKGRGSVLLLFRSSGFKIPWFLSDGLGLEENNV
jgi:hypothetical protein